MKIARVVFNKKTKTSIGFMVIVETRNFHVLKGSNMVSLVDDILCYL